MFERDAGFAQQEVARQNPWYTDSQFAWAEQPYIRPIYAKREAFIRASVSRIAQSFQGDIRMLDAGCGDGYWLSRLTSLPGVCWSGIDYNPLRIQRVKNLLPQVHLEVSEIARYKPTHAFHGILFSHVLEHIHDDRNALRLLASHLVPNGFLILGVPNEGSRIQQKYLKRNRIKTDHVHFYTEEKLESKIKEAGFVVRDVFREVFFLFSDGPFYFFCRYQPLFWFLEFLTQVWPKEGSGLYFFCQKSQEAEFSPRNGKCIAHT